MEELTQQHTGLLRLGLAVQQSIVFWQKAVEDLSSRELTRLAFDQGWYPELSKPRVSYLVSQLDKRFPFPARKLLEFRARSEERQNLLVCHWHLQLTDPLYRMFSGEFLLTCWSSPTTSIDLEASTRWVEKQTIAKEWKPVTVRRMASGLLSAATEAGLCSGKGRKERELRLPQISNEDVLYLKSLLKLAKAEHNLNTYLMTVGGNDEMGELTHG